MIVNQSQLQGKSKKKCKDIMKRLYKESETVGNFF